MNHFVPDFDTDDDSIIPPLSSSSSSLNLPRKSPMAEEDIMELLWHNGQVVLHSQTHQRPDAKKPSAPPQLAGGVGGADPPHPPPAPPPQDHNLFIQEDEMASWLHYPLHEDDFCSDLLDSAPQPQSTSRAASSVLHEPPPERPTNQVSAPKPPVPPKTVRNFANFSRFRGSSSSGGEPSSSSAKKALVRESPPLCGSDATRRADGTDTRWSIVSGGAETGGCVAHEISGTSSSKGMEENTFSPPATEIDGDRKRKGRESMEETECRSEETKEARGSASTKRSRAAQVHNLSERRRRDRINERMRALQELVPRCNKSDKASMLDEAIEYIKSLQLQVQMMSVGYSMAPMMYPNPGMQQYMQQMAMGMGMGMEMGMNRAYMPFPNMLAAQSLPTMAHMGGPAFPNPAFPVPNAAHASDPSRVNVQSQQADPQAAMNSLHTQHQNQPQQQPFPGFMDPYQQYLGLQSLHPMQAAMLQNQATAQPSSSSKEPEDRETPPAG